MHVTALFDPFTAASRWFLLSSFLLVAVIGVPLPGWAADQPKPWQNGQYRDFAPEAPTSSPGKGVTTRSLGPTLKLTQTAVQRPKLSPGDLASLRAQYTVEAPTGPIDVRETRIVRFNGSVLTTLTKTASRSSGPVGSEFQLKIPPNAVEGWYTVTTIVEPAQLTRSISKDQSDATFYIEPAGGAPAPSPGAPRSDDESVKIKLWASKPQYKVGDTLTVSFETNRDAFVTLVNVGTSGALTILFPNRFSGGHAVKANKVYTVPAPDDDYELVLSGPTGTELVYALVTLKPVQFIETDFSRTPQVFQPLSRGPVAFTRDINAVAKKTPLQEQARATLELQISP